MTREEKLRMDLEKYWYQHKIGYGAARAWAMVKKIDKELEMYDKINKKVKKNVKICYRE